MKATCHGDRGLMGLDVDDALDCDLIRFPFFNEVFKASAESIERTRLLDACGDGNHSVVEGFRGGVVAFENGVACVTHSWVDSEGAH